MTVEIINPATGQVTYRHELMGAADIEQRLQAAADAFPGWADHSLQDRGAILRQIAAQLRARRDDLQQAMTHEMGKLKAEALAEVDKCAAACEYYADHAADYLKPQLIDTEAQRSYVRYEPIGCVFAVMPWNFPIWQVFRFLAPAFMAGNVALLKHASNVPQCADLILAVCRDGGLPFAHRPCVYLPSAPAAGFGRRPLPGWLSSLWPRGFRDTLVGVALGEYGRPFPRSALCLGALRSRRPAAGPALAGCRRGGVPPLWASGDRGFRLSLSAR